MNKVLAVCLVAMLLVSFSVAEENSWTAAETRRQSFEAGKLMLHLGAGDAKVIARSDLREIIVRSEVRDSDKVRDVKVRFESSANQTDVYVQGPNHFRYTVEIPSRVDLFLRMTAGDLTVRGVEGSIDAELRAGDFTLELPHIEGDYGPVNLSVGVGDLNADAFHTSKGGMWRHFNLERQAKYRLHARTGAGDLVVSASPK